MSIAALTKSEKNGDVLTTVKQLNSVDTRGTSTGTEISFPIQASSPYLLKKEFIVPRFPACISAFATYKDRYVSPFRGTFFGTVFNPMDSDVSMKGNAKKFFELVDASGDWFQCCASGRNASSKALKEGSKIVVYFAAGREQTNERSGILYLWPEAVIIKTGNQVAPILRRNQMTF